MWGHHRDSLVHFVCRQCMLDRCQHLRWKAAKCVALRKQHRAQQHASAHLCTYRYSNEAVDISSCIVQCPCMGCLAQCTSELKTRFSACVQHTMLPEVCYRLHHSRMQCAMSHIIYLAAHLSTPFCTILSASHEQSFSLDLGSRSCRG